MAAGETGNENYEPLRPTEMELAGVLQILTDAIVDRQLDVEMPELWAARAMLAAFYAAIEKPPPASPSADTTSEPEVTTAN